MTEGTCAEQKTDVIAWGRTVDLPPRSGGATKARQVRGSHRSNRNSTVFYQSPASPPTQAPGLNPSSPKDRRLLRPIPSDTSVQVLNRFRQENLKYLPFIYIPPHITPEELYEDKPFFWECVVAVLTPNLKEREALFMKVHDTIHQKLLVEATPSLDILLGVMTFMSWRIYSAKPFLNFYSHILTGLVCDLGIDKAAFREQPVLERFHRVVGVKTETATGRTLEERRAVLGCFLITSRFDSQPRTGITVGQCVDDETLVWLVKIQLMVDKAYRLRRDEEVYLSTPLVMDLLQSQLSSVRGQIPLHLQQSSLILMYLANAELAIHELSIRVPMPSNDPDPQELKSLDLSLQAAKSWLDVWLSVPPEHYLTVSAAILFQLCRALVNLYKLSTLGESVWDNNERQSTVNLLHYLDLLQVNFKRASNHLNQPADVNIFEKGVTMISSIRQRCGLVLADTWHPSPGMAEVTFQEAADASNFLRWDHVDDAWMMEYLGFL
ncbi:hypothetical protein ETB97_007186 [Aspergillus alliaceus]|uniref:Transcription factor domain-containing protein n=1 Tax=Petromyces alliaceus TaxID=209559 RepID=A0A8H6AEW2_PETAA|nr:hypothetical protein ETB97_007186 [Aspergillus burnettii]